MMRNDDEAEVTLKWKWYVVIGLGSTPPDSRPPKCRVAWGSHACRFDQGHTAPHECDCCPCDLYGGHDEQSLHLRGCVAKPPYYGADTVFRVS